MEKNVLFCGDGQATLTYCLTTHRDLRTIRWPSIRRLLNRHHPIRRPTWMAQSRLHCPPGLVERFDFVPNVRPYPLQIYFPRLNQTGGRAETNEEEDWDIAVVAEHWNAVRG